MRPRDGIKLSRMRLGGVVLGIPCLVWSAWHGCIMLEGGLAKYHPVVWALVPVTAVLCYFFLDYLFARAAGGFFILCANELLRQSFAHAVLLRPVYSVACLLLGIAGLFMLGVPWRVRDTFELASEKPVAGRWIAGILLFPAFVLIVLCFF